MKKLNLEQGSEEWKMERLEKISGTRLASAIGSPAKQETLLDELIAERITGEPLPQYVSGAMVRGSEAEEFAVEEYEKRTGNKIERVGMCVSDKYEWLTNSPDGLVGKDGAIEVKCPNTVKAVRYQRGNEIPKDYFDQCMSYFLVNEKLKWLDFIVYDPRIKEEKMQLWVKRMERDKEKVKEAEEKALEFYDKWQNELSSLGLGF